MELAYRICRLGRSARNSANIKNRQPLAKMLLSTRDLPEYYVAIINEELNIKEIEVNANMSDYVSYEVRPNPPVLGKTHGKFIPGIRKAISEMNQMELALKLAAGETLTVEIDGTKLDLNSQNLQVTMNGLNGFTFAGEGETGVVLDTHISKELKEEGYAREIISKLQNMRKDSNFEVTDKIKVYVSNNEVLLPVINKFKDYMMKDTLAVNIVFNENKEYTEVNINGEKLGLAIEKQL
jgi:isoleucyl-tRNA synthetase